MAGAAWVAALLAAGCAKEGRPATGWEADPDAVRVEASVGTATKTSPLGTGDEQTKFSKGDRIAVAALDNGTVKKTVKYQFDGLSWAPVADESGATDYLVWNTPVTFRSWYPASASGDEFNLPQDQSGANGSSLADADFMTWSAEYKDDASIPEGRKLSIVMQRQMALVTIVIDKIEDQYDYIKNPQFETVKISSAHTSVKRQSDGTFAPEGDPCGIYAVKHEVDGKTAFSAIVAPGEAKKDVVFLFFYIGNGKDYFDNKVVGIPAAEAGKHYTYKLIVGKKTVKISGVTVEDWTTGSPLDGKFEAEVDNYSEWDGKKVTDTYTFSGSGTSERPYLIQSATDLAGLAANVNAGANYQGTYFKLETNIDLMGHEWTPIGGNNPFYGIFDGNSKIITNMSITAAPSSNSGVGLFGYCIDASISSVVLRNAKIAYSGKSDFPSGLICGAFSGTVKNCRVEGSIITKYGYCGGIIGEVNDDTSVSDCNVEIYGEKPWGRTGGIVGSCLDQALTIESCTVKGEINGGNDGFGGIAGSLQGYNVLVKNCSSYARLGKATDGTTPRVGGLVGRFTYGKAESCTVYGSISFTNDSGLVGGMFSDARDVTLSNLNFSGDIDVTIQGESYIVTTIGAFIAWLGGTATTATGCTYKKSGTGNYSAIGKFDEENFDNTRLDIVGI